MATNQTTNYQLNQWEPTDQVLRTDFNADNAKIDAALKANADAAQALQSGKADAQTVSALAKTSARPVTTAAWRSARTSATAMSGRPPPRSQARFIRCSC